MASSSTLIKLITILTLVIFFLSYNSSSFSIVKQNQEHNDIEAPTDLVPSMSRRRLSKSPFLKKKVKRGDHCNKKDKNICNGVSLNNGTSLLQCCKHHCKDVLSDKGNCGKCGHKCKQGNECCNGSCILVHKNVTHCGKCNYKCAPGQKCELGFCGYS